MKKHFAVLLFVVLALGLCVPPVFAQASGTVKGVCKDPQGNPIVDGVLVFANQDNGQKYTLKTNKKGEYFSLGIAPGKYVVTLYKTADDAKANKELFHQSGFQVQLDENTLDFDLKKEQERAAQGQGLTPEQIKQMQEAKEKQQKEVTTVKALNEKLSASNTAMQGGDFETAIDAAVEAYQKAVQLRQAVTNDKDPNAAKNLAAYYNNLAEAYAKAGKIDDAVKTYALAAQTDPTAAAQYYFNTGAVCTNAGKVDDAIVAFDKVIAADPNRADAYYWKGVNMIGKATLQGDKMVAPPGTAEAFQKYLELQPTGANADAAKQMLASIGASVETSFGKKKAAPKK